MTRGNAGSSQPATKDMTMDDTTTGSGVSGTTRALGSMPIIVCNKPREIDSRRPRLCTDLKLDDEDRGMVLGQPES